MKKLILLSGFALLSSSTIFAQAPKEKSVQKPAMSADSHAGHDHAAKPAPSATQPAANQNADLSMKFKTEEHSFGNIPEGPSVSYDFEFTNIGKEPIILSNVQASCGCTTPTWPKEPITPGKSGKITATYSTQGRPGPFTKTITVTSNVGSKVLKISGTVEKAPDSSVPTNNSSILKN
jgi:hypothetical protein